MNKTLLLSIVGCTLLTACGNRDKLLYPENDLAVKLERKTIEETQVLDNITCVLKGEYPQISGHNNKPIEEKINALLEERIATPVLENVRSCPEELKNMLVTGTEALDTVNMDFRLKTNEMGVLSVVYITSQFLEGSAHPSNSIGAVNLDLRTGEEYTLQNIFIDGFDAKAEVNKRILTMEQTEGLNAEGIADIRNENPTFYFSRGELILTDLFTVHAIQGAELKIPLEELKDVANPTGPIAALLGM